MTVVHVYSTVLGNVAGIYFDGSGTHMSCLWSSIRAVTIFYPRVSSTSVRHQLQSFRRAGSECNPSTLVRCTAPYHAPDQQKRLTEIMLGCKAVGMERETAREWRAEVHSLVKLNFLTPLSAMHDVLKSSAPKPDPWGPAGMQPPGQLADRRQEPGDSGRRLSGTGIPSPPGRRHVVDMNREGAI